MSDFDSLGFQPHATPAASAPVAPAAQKSASPAPAAAVDHFADLGFEPHESPKAAVPAPKSNDELIKQNIQDMEDRDSAQGNAFMDTLLLGHLPQVKAKLKQIIAGDGISNDEGYVKRRDEEIKNLKDEGEKYPWAKATGTAGGMIVPMVASMGAAAPAEAAEAIPFVTRVGRSLLQSAKTGALYGAAQNPGDVEGKVDPLQLSARAENAKTGAEIGGAIGVGVPTIAEGLQRGKPVAQWAAQKAGKVFASIPEETTARYLDNPELVNSAPSRSDIADRLLDLKKTADDSVVKAHEELSGARQKLAEAKVDTRSGLQDQKFDAGRELNEHQANFNEKKQQFKEALKTNNLTSMAGEVTDAVGQLKDKVVQGSKDAYEILSKEKGDVNIDPLVKTLQSHYADQFVNGVAKSPEAGQTAQEIRDWQQRLFNMTKETDGKLSLPQAKEMMQELDQSISYRGKQQAGTFAPSTEKALTNLRGEIDSSVKGQSPAYREKMKDVAEQAKLLNDTSKLYGTPEKAIQNLNNIDSEKGQAIHVPLLKALSDHTGKDLREPVAGYLYNQKVLSTPSLFEHLLSEQPEGKALAASKAKMEQISNPDYIRSTNAKAMTPLQQKIDEAAAQLEEAKGKAKTFSGITPDSVTGKQKALNGANSYGAEDRFSRIDKEHGTNFEKEIQARNDADQFNKVDQAGSRKTLAGGALGGLIGWFGGHSGEAAAVGAAIGSHAGTVADKYSGQAFKGLLDAGRGVGKVTAAVGKAAENTAPKITAAVMLSGAGNKGPDKWASDGFSKLMDHAGAEDKELLNSSGDQIMKSKSVKNLLISASDLKPGSKAMEDILSKVKAKLEEEK